MQAKPGLVFPGQGSQKVGMLAALAETCPVVAETFAEASDVLGYDLWELSQNGPQQELNLTERTQPLLLTAGVALWRVWQTRGGATPALMAGHSLGEFTALVCAGTLGFADAVALVRQRGAFMQAAVPVGVGTMAGIMGLDDAAIETACRQAAGNEVVEAVNYNAPGQVVIAGHAGAVERAIALCKEAGAKRGVPLPVSAPFHTSLMRPAGEQLAVAIEALVLAPPQIPVVHNVTADCEPDPEKIRALLVEQIYSPVRWVDCVRRMATAGISTVVECGPGSVLAGLTRRIDRTLAANATDTPELFERALTDVAALS